MKEQTKVKSALRRGGSAVALLVAIGSSIGSFAISDGLVSSYRACVLERCAQILADVSDRYESVFEAYLKYSNLLLGMHGASRDPPEDQDQAVIHRALLAGQGTTATDLRATLHDKMQLAFGAQSRLMLLGEDACRKRAEQFHVAVLKADKSFRFDGREFDLSKYVEVTTAVPDARDKFYVEMSKAFEHTRDA